MHLELLVAILHAVPSHMVSKTALTTLKKAGRAELQSLAALSELQHSLHHVLAKAQAMQQLGSAGLKGGGVQLVQAI
eukprot:scaffold88470_cov24-Tisochrysis_lutea.AAC.1